ncbi:hypothetical protein L1987_44582 [Smallanthus sonchifolius]|uniref:Uncharacterized protein n=1 Tax=Smallanthus sonchifolius TaxID=185202 RepID=A0ACB9GPT7_9ASTR|nr:hypothetical protein L1987_44582 [Smallanthus sonchifolius]
MKRWESIIIILMLPAIICTRPGEVFLVLQRVEFRHVWISDALNSTFDYCYRSYLAKSAGVQTVVLVPTDIGVVEVGSIQSVSENRKLLEMIRSSFSVNQFEFEPTAVPGKLAVRKPEDPRLPFSNWSQFNAVQKQFDFTGITSRPLSMESKISDESLLKRKTIPDIIDEK